MSTEEACTFFFRSGGDCSKVSDVLENSLGEAPLYYWIDPRPEFPGSENKVDVFGSGIPNIADFPLNELRLFWKKRALHAVLMDSGKWHWFEYSEEKQDDDAWQPLAAVTMERSQPVLLRKQWASKNITIVNYHYCNRLIAWRLETGSEEIQDARKS